MAFKVDDWLKNLTLEEKASLCSGKDFWSTKAVERLGIPSWTMTDGPHGLRKQRSHGTEVELNNSVPATCFPSGVGLASTWNRELIQKVGEALGRESKAEQVGVILGPAVNIKRSPLAGRNFEYLSEDPYLAGQMAKHHILGVQSQGVGASIKHFAANNQEKNRMTVDTIVDERTLREIYLPAFEVAVKEAQPWTVMCSYNKINGTYASENPWLLTELLKKEWGHEGLVVTDWGACNDRVEGLKAGQEFEMPGNGGLTDADLIEAVQKGRLSEVDLDRSVRRVLELTAKVVENLDAKATFDKDSHHALARQVAAESFVLLKNSKGLLPISEKKVALIGAFAKRPRYQGGGSSHITPTKVDSVFDEIQARSGGAQVSFSAGYSLQNEADDATLIQEAVEAARKAPIAILFLGLTDAFESEGFDRTHLRLPANQTRLLDELLKVQSRVVVVLSNGAPVEMPWEPRVDAILESYLGGQAWGGAVADVLWGHVSPSGKLAETFPRRLQDTPSYLHFGGIDRVEYREGVFVGYRYSEAAEVVSLFPFGHGLSYTQFTYSDVRLDKSSITDRQTVTLSFTIANTGKFRGAEVVQVYIKPRAPKVVRPIKELKGFTKVWLNVGETQTVTIDLDQRAFAHWSETEQDWRVEAGLYSVVVGSSSQDLHAEVEVELRPTEVKIVYDSSTRLGDLVHHPEAGTFVSGFLRAFQAQFGQYEADSAEAKMMEVMSLEMPLRNLVRMSSGKVPQVLITALLGVVNGNLPASALEPFTPKKS